MSDSLNVEAIAATATDNIVDAQHPKRGAEGSVVGGTERGADAKRHNADGTKEFGYDLDDDAGGKKEFGYDLDGFVVHTPLYEDGSSDEDGLPDAGGTERGANATRHDVQMSSGQKAKPGYLETSFESTCGLVREQKATITRLTDRVHALEKQLAFERQAHAEELDRVTNVIQHISSLLQCTHCGAMCPLLWTESGSVYCKDCFEEAAPTDNVRRIRKLRLLQDIIVIVGNAQ